MGWIGKSPDRDKEEDGMTQAMKKAELQVWSDQLIDWFYFYM